MESATITAQTGVPGSIPARAWAWLRRNALMIYAGFAVAYMLVPIAVIAVFSFAETPRDRLNFAISDGFTLEYWQNAFSVVELNEAMLLSLELAALATLISTAIGTLMALALVRHQFFGRRATNLLILLPIATPEIVVGAALLSMFIIYSVTLGFTTLLIAHVMFSISFVVVVVRSRLIGFDRSIEEAAADLGATPVQTFRYVTLPLLAPGVMAAALLAFALSIDDFVISNFNSGNDGDLPALRLRRHCAGIPVQVNVLATILFVVHGDCDRPGPVAATPRRADGIDAPRAGGDGRADRPGGRAGLSELEPQVAGDAGLVRLDVQEHGVRPARRVLDVHLRLRGRLRANAVGQLRRLILGRRADQQVPPAAMHLEALVLEPPGEIERLAQRWQVHSNLPLVPAGALLRDLVPLLLGRSLLVGFGKRHGGVLPRLLIRMPAGQPRVRAQALGHDQVARHPLGFPRLLLARGVEEHPRPVAGHDHPIAQALARLVVEVQRAQPLGERQPVLLVFEVDLDPPFLGHRRKSLMAVAGRALPPAAVAG